LKLRSLATVAAVATAVLFAAPASAREPGPYKVQQLAAGAQLPKSIKVRGKQVLQVWTWQESDFVGTGYAVFSQTETAEDDHVTGRQLYVQLYTGKGDAQKQLRLVQDGVRDCELDVVASFVEGSVSVTDVDGDGKNELTFAYDLACKGDISANVRKLLVLEHKDKHALRGTSRIVLGDLVEGGDYKPDGFKKQPALKTLAETRWKELLGT